MYVALFKCSVLVTVVLGGIWTSTSWAGDWQHEASLSLQSSHETNPQLDSNRRKVTLGQVSPAWTSIYSTETVSASTSLGTTFVRSSDQVVQSNSVRYDTNTTLDASFEKLTARGELNFFRRDFQNTEFNDNELTTDESSASVSEDVTVDDLTFQTRFDRALSPRLSVFADNNYRIVEFSGGDSTNFANATFTAGANGAINDRLVLTPSVGFTRFEPDDTDPTNLFRVQLGANYTASDTSLYELTIGGIKTDTEYDVSLEALYQQEFELFALDASASRDLAPSDDGELREENTVQIGVSHEFSVYTRARVDAEWQVNDDIEARRVGINLTHDLSEDTTIGLRVNFVRSYSDSGTGDQITSSIQTDPFVAWRISEEVDARLSYREVQLDQTGSDRVRTRRLAFLINYATPFE